MRQQFFKKCIHVRGGGDREAYAHAYEYIKHPQPQPQNPMYHKYLTACLHDDAEVCGGGSKSVRHNCLHDNALHPLVVCKAGGHRTVVAGIHAMRAVVLPYYLMQV